MLPAEAQKMGSTEYCNGKQQVCAHDSQNNEKYCYKKPVTTVLPQLIITAHQFVTTTPTTRPVPATCPAGCSCNTLEDGKQHGLGLCGGIKTLCGYTANQQPEYCHGTPSTGPALITGITGSGVTVTTTPPLVQAVPRVVITETETDPSRRVLAQRCTISGRIYGFVHNRSSLRVRFTPEGGVPSDVYTFPEEGPIDAVTQVLTYFSLVPCTGGVYDIEPVYVPDDDVCPWTVMFTPANITGVRTNGSSIAGQDFTFSRTDSRMPGVDVSFSPPDPGVGEEASLIVRGTDDTGITVMTVVTEWHYNDGDVEVYAPGLDPDPGAPAGGLLPSTATVPFGAPWYRNLNHVIVNAKACDAAGNEGRDTATLYAGSCDDNYMNRDETQIDCGGTQCGPCVPCTWCGTEVFPLRITGTTADMIDVVFIPADDYEGDWREFVRDSQAFINNGYYRNDAIALNGSKFNFYYMKAEGSGTGAPECGFTPPLGSCEDFQDATSFAEAIAVLHKTAFRDWSATRCDRRVFFATSGNYRVFVHESGHAVFGLKDEYCCDSHYSQQTLLPNIWSSRDNCTDDADTMGWNRRDCAEFCTSGRGNCGSGFWDIDPPSCIMDGSDCSSGDGMCPFEQGCIRRVNYVFSQYP